MKRIISEYILLLCAITLFDGIKCDQFVLDSLRNDMELNRTIEYTAKCLRENTSENVSIWIMKANIFFPIFTSHLNEFI